MALTDLLTQIAGSIRSKDGTTDTIKATDFPQRILDIPSGVEIPYDIDYGEFELMEDMLVMDSSMCNPYVIEHSLGKIPLMFKLWIGNAENVGQGTLNNADFQKHPCSSRSNQDYTIYRNGVYRTNADSGAYASNSVGGTSIPPFSDIIGSYIAADKDKIYIGNQALTGTAYQYILRAGNVYKWIAIAERE